MQGEWRWKLELAWIGTNYVGWQRQPNGLSIQQAVEAALSEILGGAKANVHAAGRTDAGVHALRQVAVTHVKVKRTAQELMRGLNARLPRDIVCLAVTEAPRGFNPRATTKLYRYRVLNRPVRCPSRHQRVWHLSSPLRVEPMAQGAMHLVGEHDFSSFRATRCSARHPRRTITQARVFRAPDDEIHFEFVGNGFLRHQVRIMVGALVEVGQGAHDPDWIAWLVAARDRTLAARTAPAHGLWLVRTTGGLPR